MKLYFDVIMGDKFQNSFMGAVDLSDRGKKYYCDIHTLTMTYESEVIDKSKIDKTIITMREALEAQRKVVVFIGFRSLDIDSMYLKEGVQTVSNGKKFCIFEELLKNLGYEVEIDEIRQVISAKFIGHPVS